MTPAKQRMLGARVLPPAALPAAADGGCMTAFEWMILFTVVALASAGCVCCALACWQEER